MVRDRLISDLATVTARVDQQRAAGVISAREHIRLLADVQLVLDERRLTWDDLAAAIVHVEGGQYPGPTAGQTALFPT